MKHKQKVSDIDEHALAATIDTIHFRNSKQIVAHAEMVHEQQRHESYNSITQLCQSYQM